MQGACQNVLASIGMFGVVDAVCRYRAAPRTQIRVYIWYFRIGFIVGEQRSAKIGCVGWFGRFADALRLVKNVSGGEECLVRRAFENWRERGHMRF